MARQGRGGTSGWPFGVGRHWALVGIIAFIVVDVVLVGWAMSSVSATPSYSADAFAATDSPAPTTPTPLPTPTATATTLAVIPNAVAPTRVLAALNGTVAWRAATGPCPATAAALEHTSDGGATWTPTDAAGPTGASSVLRITVTSAAEAAAITLNGTNCAPQYIGTFVSGDNWATYPAELAGSWYLEPGTPAAVHSPHGDATAPCDAPIGLAARDASHAAVLCSDHRVFRTSDAGASWGTPLAVTGAVALTSTANGYVAAATEVSGCSGVAVSRFDAAQGAATAAGCFATATPRPGTVVVAAGSGSLWLWAGDTVVRSQDGGVTWR